MTSIAPKPEGASAQAPALERLQLRSARRGVAPIGARPTAFCSGPRSAARSSVALRLALAVSASAWLPACVFELHQPMHPVALNAPASEEDTHESRSAAVLGAASRDLGCGGVEIVMVFRREYANVAQPRYVVQGCGRRAVYAEDCGHYPRCTYLAVSVVSLEELGRGAEPAAP